MQLERRKLDDCIIYHELKNPHENNGREITRNQQSNGHRATVCEHCANVYKSEEAADQPICSKITKAMLHQ